MPFPFEAMGLGQFGRSGYAQPQQPAMSAGIMAPRKSAEDQRLLQDPAFQQQYRQWVMAQGPGAGDWATPTGYQQWLQQGGKFETPPPPDPADVVPGGPGQPGLAEWRTHGQPPMPPPGMPTQMPWGQIPWGQGQGQMPPTWQGQLPGQQPGGFSKFDPRLEYLQGYGGKQPPTGTPMGVRPYGYGQMPLGQFGRGQGGGWGSAFGGALGGFGGLFGMRR